MEAAPRGGLIDREGIRVMAEEGDKFTSEDCSLVTTRAADKNGYVTASKRM